jgi:hypothetical protein
MISVDLASYAEAYRQERLAEAERERLVSLLPKRGGALRRDLAQLCFRLASWLDGPVRYVRRVESGDEDWVAPWASV